MRNTSTKIILTACKMSFDGTPDREISEELGIHGSVITRGRKTKEWKEFEAELIEAHKRTLLGNVHRVEALDSTS